MPEIETRKHKVEPKEEQDVIIKTGKFRLYFQNYYTIISLGNDLLTGGLYLAGSLANLFEAPPIWGQLCYLAGGLFLLMRPILKIIQNFFIYNEEEYQEVMEVSPGDEKENKSDEEYNEEYYDDQEK